MSLFHCRFCDHDNPAGARFCNACGSPLYLEPCPKCESVNDVTATHCYQCGVALRAEPAQAEPTGAVPEFADATQGAGASGGEHQKPAGAFAERFEVEFGEFRPSLFGDLGTDATKSQRAAPYEPHVSAVQPGLPDADDAAPPRDPVKRTRAASVAALTLLALVIVGAAAYYTYEHSYARIERPSAVAASPPIPQPQAPAVEANVNAPTSPASVPPAQTAPEPQAPVAETPATQSDSAAANAVPDRNAPNAAVEAPPNETQATAANEPAQPARTIPSPRRSAAHATARALAPHRAKAPPPPDASAAASAAATQRIIERELGTRTAPASNPTPP